MMQARRKCYGREIETSPAKRQKTTESAAIDSNSSNASEELKLGPNSLVSSSVPSLTMVEVERVEDANWLNSAISKLDLALQTFDQKVEYISVECLFGMVAKPLVHLIVEYMSRTY